MFQTFKPSLPLKNQLHLITCKAVKTCVTLKLLQKGKVFNDFHYFHSFSLNFLSLPVTHPPHGSVSFCCLCSHPKPPVHDLLFLFSTFSRVMRARRGSLTRMSRGLSWAVSPLSTRLVTVLALALPSCTARAVWRLSGYEGQRLLPGWSTTRGMQHAGWRWSCSNSSSRPRRKR